jgi:predicted TIM-barrel fold metal-dependent hydrolase
MVRPVRTLLPDPQLSERHYLVISVDDHLTEPADVFEGRVPAKFAERAPQIIELPDGTQKWSYDNELYSDAGIGVVAGRPIAEWSRPMLRYDEMRPGCWNVHERVRDMDLDGVWASICFPSLAFGFSGRMLSLNPDTELALATVRAWNDWLLEEWVGAYPDRFIPMQLPFLPDPAVAAAEIRRNAERGFKAVSFLDAPHRQGLPAITAHEHWEPFMRACEETETVICLHAGASGHVLEGSPNSLGGTPLTTTLFPGGAFLATVDWIWATIPVRYPKLKIALSEGGIGWVPMAIDRLDYVMKHSAGAGGNEPWPGDISPSEALRRNFYFCMLDDPTTLPARDVIGIDHIMFETDYPHADSTWPHSQELLAQRFAGVSREDADRITHLNAASLFRHPLPDYEEWYGAGGAPAADAKEAVA